MGKRRGGEKEEERGGKGNGRRTGGVGRQEQEELEKE